MIKFDVLNRFTGKVQFTAEIDCAEDAPRSIKLGLALRWGVEAGAYFAGADFTDANFTGADFTDADFTRADFTRANFTGANFTGADFTRADFTDADFTDAIGNRREVKSLQIDTWSITYTSTHLQIGCQRHKIEDWWEFDDETINDMDGAALEWWRKWKAPLRQLIELSPAEPTGCVSPAEETQSDD